MYICTPVNHDYLYVAVVVGRDHGSGAHRGGRGQGWALEGDAAVCDGKRRGKGAGDARALRVGRRWRQETGLCRNRGRKVVDTSWIYIFTDGLYSHISVYCLHYALGDNGAKKTCLRRNRWRQVVDVSNLSIHTYPYVNCSLYASAAMGPRNVSMSKPPEKSSDMAVSRSRRMGLPSSGIVLRTLFLLAADLRRHPTHI